jgi:hypothetical protein
MRKSGPANLPVFSENNSKVILVSSLPPTLEEEALSGIGEITKLPIGYRVADKSVQSYVEF